MSERLKIVGAVILMAVVCFLAVWALASAGYCHYIGDQSFSCWMGH